MSKQCQNYLYHWIYSATSNFGIRKKSLTLPQFKHEIDVSETEKVELESFADDDGLSNDLSIVHAGLKVLKNALDKMKNNSILTEKLVKMAEFVLKKSFLNLMGHLNNKYWCKNRH